MATTTAGARLTEGHRMAQVAESARIIRDMSALWSLFDPSDPGGSFPAWSAAVTRLVASGHQRSAVLSRAYFLTFRATETGAALTTPLPLATIPAEQVAASMAATGPPTIARGIRLGKSLEEAAQAANVATARAASRLALTGGRATLVEAVRRDPRALGHARVTSGSPCAFCALLAARGPVYGSEATARFHAHDTCHCSSEPVYRRDQPWPGNAREWARQYAEHKNDPDPLNSFRRAFESAGA